MPKIFDTVIRHRIRTVLFDMSNDLYLFFRKDINELSIKKLKTKCIFFSLHPRWKYCLYVGYLGRRFEFFQRRFAPEGVPTLINSVPSRSRRALFGTRFVDPPSGAYSQKPPKILKISVFPAAIRSRRCSNSDQYCSR